MRAGVDNSQCSMSARAALAFLALAVGACAATQQPDSIWVDVVDVSPNTEDPVEAEKQYTAELGEELQSAKDDALLLYTEFQARSAVDLKMFLMNITGLSNVTIGSLDQQLLDNVPESCRSKFERRLADIVYNARRAAGFSAENHHKFFLGHMIVFRIHLNKSEDYIKKCDRVIQACGTKCESTPKMVRWRRLALDEITRVRDDLQHSRRHYRDLLAHAHRRMKTLRRQALAKATDAVKILHDCSG